jgi:ADP-heptose:LPS heptosyltransferase/SAM-dependent methyltransferase
MTPHATPAPGPGAAAPACSPPVERLTVSVCTAGGIGDLIIAAHLVQELYDELDACCIDVYYPDLKVAEFVFHRAPFVRRVEPAYDYNTARASYDLTVLVLQYVKYEVQNPDKLARVNPGFARRLERLDERFESYRGLYERQPTLDGLYGRISVRAGRNVIANLGHFGLEADTLKRCALTPDPDAYATACRLVPPTVPYLTVHDGFDTQFDAAPGSATKCWPLPHWNELVSRLKAAFPELTIVQLGASRSRPIEGVDLNLINRTSLKEAAWLLKGALLHVDSDSGLVHLARAVSTPSVVLFGPTDPQYYGYSQNRNLDSDQCGNCWWSTPDWLLQCPRGLATPACMSSITPDQVFAAVLKELEKRRNPLYQSSDYALYDSRLPGKGEAQLADIFARVGLAPVPITRHTADPVKGVYLHASKQWEYLYVLEQIEAHGARAAQGLRIADVGGGRGALTPYLASLGHQVQVFDLDYQWDNNGDWDTERRYRAWARERGFRAEYGSLYNLPVDDESFDVVLCVSVVEHARFKECLLREALRTLKFGGVLILTFDYALDPEALEDGLRQEIFSPERLRATLGQLGIPAPGLPAGDLEQSSRAIQRDGVLGIPHGMTVAGLVISKTY